MQITKPIFWRISRIILSKKELLQCRKKVNQALGMVTGRFCEGQLLNKNTGHFLLITIFVGRWWPEFYKNSDQSSGTVAEIRRNYQLKRKLEGKSIAYFVHNFPRQNHYCPPTWLVIPLLYILIKYRASLVCCLLVYYCCLHQLRIVDKSNFQNGAAHEIDVLTSDFGAGVFWQI